MLGKNNFCESGEEQQQVVWRSCECPIPGSVQHEVGWGSEQPEEFVPIHSRRVGTR